MAMKILKFFGLSSDDPAMEPRKSRDRSEYMRKIQSLVVPEDGVEEDDGAAEEFISRENAFETASAGEPEEVHDAADSAPAEELPPAEPSDADEDAGEEVEYHPRGRHAAPSGKSLAGIVRNFRESLRSRREDDVMPLVLVRRDFAEQLDDIKDALLKGQTILLDFEMADRATCEQITAEMINYMQMHRGFFYMVNSFSMLLTMSPDSVEQWQCADDEETAGENAGESEEHD